MDDNSLEQFKHPDKVNEIPYLRDILKFIIPYYAADWKVLGVLLDIPKEQLRIIEADNPGNVRNCCIVMFVYWRESEIVSTWQNLLAAIESIPVSSCDKLEKGSSSFVLPEDVKVNETPCLQDIFKLIVPHYAADWEDLGVLLDIPRHYLKTIKVDNPCSVERCCEKMFTYWLSSKDIVSTWQNLLAAIELLPMSSCDKMEKGGLNLLPKDIPVTSTPLLKDLYLYITPYYATHWNEIGILLGLPSGKLKCIETDYPANITRCCNEMFNVWLEMDITASWKDLFTAIESPAVSSHVNISDKEMFKKSYYQAKRNLGTEKLQLYKLIIFGPPGVGKSSLFNVLLGGNPDQERSSTGVLNRKLVQAKVAINILTDLSKSSWNLITIEDEILRLRSAIEKVIRKSKQTGSNLPTATNMVESATSKVKEKKLIQSSTVIHTEAIESGNSEMKVEKKLFQPPTTAHTQIEYASTIMACYDSGGQPEFFDVMPALMTIPTGNVMVFNLSKNIHTEIDSDFYEEGKSSQSQYQAHYTTAELMKTAIANIQSYSKNTCSDTSNFYSEPDTDRLLVVGTHLDKCGPKNDEKQQRLSEIEVMMCNDVLTGEIMQIVHCDDDGSIIHPISNTFRDGRDEAAQKIRTAIENMSKYGKSQNEIPINWLLFQLEVQLTGKDYIAQTECFEIARNCYIKENEVHYVLMYFHELGILLHFSKISELKDIVFCNPQYLFDHLTELIKFKYHKTARVQKDIKIGIFNKQLLCDIYSKRLDAKGVLKAENLITLFSHLKIMSELPNKPDHYFMPALLNPAPKDVSLQREYGEKVHDTMLVKFDSKYFPRGMFCCLTTHLIQIEWEIQFKFTHKNLIVFQYIANHYVALFDKIDHMAAEIYCTEDSVSPSYHYVVCDKLFKSLKALCQQFRMNADFKFGFTCNDCKKFAGFDLQYPVPNVYSCKECQKSFKPNNDQLAWFLPLEFSKFYKPQVSASQQFSHEPASAAHFQDPSYYNKKPKMWDLIKIVIPKIKAEWRDLAYCMQYDPADVKGIKKDCSCLAERCTELFENWLATPKGITPKTWHTLLKCIGEVDELSAAVEKIEAELKAKYCS